MEEILIFLKLLWRIVKFILDVTSYVICTMLLVAACILPWRAVAVVRHYIRACQKDRGDDDDLEFRIECVLHLVLTIADVICVPLGLVGALVPTRTHTYFAGGMQISKKRMDDSDAIMDNLELRAFWCWLFFNACIDVLILAFCFPSLIMPTRLYAFVKVTWDKRKAFGWEADSDDIERVRGCWAASLPLALAEFAAFVLGLLGLLSGVRTCQTIKDAQEAYKESFGHLVYNHKLVKALCVNGASVIVDIVFLPLLILLCLGFWRLPPAAVELRKGFSWKARGILLLQSARLLIDALLAAPLLLVALSWRPLPREVVRAMCGEGCLRACGPCVVRELRSDSDDLEAQGSADQQGGDVLSERSAASDRSGEGSCTSDNRRPVTSVHLAIVRSAGLLALDALCCPLLLIAVLSCYRLSALCGGLRGLSFHKRLLEQSAGMMVDAPFLLAGLALLCTGYRADLVLPLCRRNSSLTAWERRQLVGKQFLLLVRDVTMVLPMLLVTITLYRLPAMALGIKASMSRLLTDEPEMHPLEVRVVAPEPSGLPSLVVRASKPPNLSGVASMQVQITGDAFWAAVAELKGSMVATAARALLPLRLRDGKEVDFGCLQHGRGDAEISIQLQKTVKRKTVAKLLGGLPPGAELLVQLEARLDTGRRAVLLAAPVTVGQLLTAVQTTDGLLPPTREDWRSLEQEWQTPAAHLAQLRGSAATADRRDSWWSPVLAEAVQVSVDVSHLMLFFLLMAFPWRFVTAVSQMFETRGRRMGRAASEVLAALDFWEVACGHIASRIEPIANSYAKRKVQRRSEPMKPTWSNSTKSSRKGEECMMSCIACFCCIFCPCCPNYSDIDDGWCDSDDEFHVAVRRPEKSGTIKDASAAFDKRLTQLGRSLRPARSLLRNSRKQWPQEPEMAELGKAVDERLASWSESFFWMLLMPEVHLLLAGDNIKQEEHARLCQVIRNRAVPQARAQRASREQFKASFEQQSEAACQLYKSRRKSVAMYQSIVRHHLATALSDLAALPCLLLLVLTVYRLPNLSLGFTRPFSARRLKVAATVEAGALLCDAFALLQLLLLSAFLTVTVVKLPDFLSGLRPSLGVRKARNWALRMVTEVAVGFMELILMLFAWKVYRLAVSAAVFLILTPAAMLALALPRSLGGRLRFAMASLAWLGAVAIAMALNTRVPAYIAVGVLLVLAFAGLAGRGVDGWASRREGDWWSPQVRWTAPNLFAIAAILTEMAALCFCALIVATEGPLVLELPADARDAAAAGACVSAAALLHVTFPMVADEDEQAAVVADGRWRAARQVLQEVLFLPVVAVLAMQEANHMAWTVALIYFVSVSTLSTAAWNTPVSQKDLLDIHLLGLNASGRQLLVSGAVIAAVSSGHQMAFAAAAATASVWTAAWALRGATVPWAEIIRAGSSAAAAAAAVWGAYVAAEVLAAATALALAQGCIAKLLRRRELAATQLPEALEALRRLQDRVSLWGGAGSSSAVSLDASTARTAAVVAELEERLPFERLKLDFLSQRASWRAKLSQAADYGEVLASLQQLAAGVAEPPTRLLLRQVLGRKPLEAGRVLPEELCDKIVSLAVPRVDARAPTPPSGWEFGQLDLAAARADARRQAARLPAELASRASEAGAMARRPSTRSHASSSSRPSAGRPAPTVVGLAEP